MDRDIGIVKCKYPDKFICAVSGNNEFTPEYEDIKTINTPKLKIMYTHGHNHGVKFSTDKLYGEAVMQNCKLALYGHTHIQEIEIVDDVYIMCPGAVMNGDYLILDIIDDKIIYSFANINSKERLY